MISYRDEITIPQLSSTEAFRNVLGEVEDSIVTDGKFDRKNLSVSFPRSSLPRVKLARVYLYLLSEADEIIENLNFTILEISNLPKLKSIARSEKVRKLRFLRRIYAYEFARVEDVFGQFLAGLGLLGYASKREIREIRNLFYSQFRPMIQARNYLIHGITEPHPDETKMEILISGEQFGRKRANTNEKLLLFDKWFTRYVRKNIIGLRVAGKELASLVQDVANTFEHGIANDSTHSKVSAS